MSEPFLGELKIISWNYPPKGWAFCDGQLLPINQNQALFSILGTTYGDGREFGRRTSSRMPVHTGNGIAGPAGWRDHASTHFPKCRHIPRHGGRWHRSGTAASTPNGTKALGQSARVPAARRQWHSGPTSDSSATTSSLNPGCVAANGDQPHENITPGAQHHCCLQGSRQKLISGLVEGGLVILAIAREIWTG